MIVRAEDFEVRHPEWISDPTITPDTRELLEAMGVDEPLNRVECLDVVDECFKCGEKLTTPYIYWNMAKGGVSLHPRCAARLALGLVQDACELAKGKRADTEPDAVDWLMLYAQKKIYRIEDEEL